MADTNGRLVELMAEMVIEMKGFRAELDRTRTELRAEFKASIGELRSELRDGLGLLATEAGSLRTDLRSEFQTSIGNLSNSVNQALGEQTQELNKSLYSVRKEIEDMRMEMHGGFTALSNDVHRLESIAEEQSVTLRVISDKLFRLESVEKRVDALEQAVFKK